MPRLRRFFEIITEDLFNFNLLLLPFGLFAGMLSGNIYLSLTLLAFILLLPYFYTLRLLVKNVWLFLPLAWLPCPLCLLTPHPMLYTVFAAFMCSYCVRRRTLMQSKLRISFEGLCFPLTFIAVIYAAAGYLRIPFMRPFIYTQAVMLLVLAMLYTHLSGINSELELASASSLQATRFITGFANKYLFVYVTGFFAVLMLFRLVPFGKAAVFIGHFIVLLLRYLFSLMSFKQGEPIGTPLTAPKQEQVDMSIDELPFWANIIEQILIYTVNILMLLVVIAFIVFFFLRLYRGFYSHKTGKLMYNDEVSQLKTEKKRRSSHRAASIKDPTRKQYYKRVNKYFKKRMLSLSDTPEEIKHKLSGKENLDTLTQAYKNARYNEEQK